MTKTLTATLFVLLAVPTFARADAQIAEWFGEYAMNHDGFQGTLRIQDSTRDCAAPAWCHLLASYVDKDGVRRLVTIRMMDQAWQHMVFYIAFPGNQQRFDGYLMSWDKSRIAGTTVWEGRTFGFFAVKRASATPPIDLGPLARGRVARPPVVADSTGNGSGSPAPGKKGITANGEVETVLPDGTRRISKPGQCGSTTIFPNGTMSTSQCSQVPMATPPFPDPVSAKWLDAHSSSLLDIIRSLLGNDQTSIDNYMRNNEPPSMGIYDRIRMRANLIAMLSGA
jgi:hypothetical protein